MNERFSTADVVPSERIVYWNRIVSEIFGPHVVEPRSTGEFAGVLLRRAYGELCLNQVTCTPATVFLRTADSPPRELEHVELTLQDVGATDHVLGNAQLQLATGTLAMHTRTASHTIAFDQRIRCVALQVPVARIASRLGDLTRLQALRVEVADAVLLAGFLRALLAQETLETEPGWGDAISDVVLDLITLTYSRVPATAVTLRPARSTTGERWQRTVRDFVDRHLGDPALGPTMIADKLGVSTRYVQMMFARMATTVTGYILAKRLELAAQLLISGDAPIIEIALRSGFVDRSYFYRSFRKRFGVSPGRYAAQAR